MACQQNQRLPAWAEEPRKGNADIRRQCLRSGCSNSTGSRGLSPPKPKRSAYSSANVIALSQFVGPPQPTPWYIAAPWRGGLNPSVPSSVCAEKQLRSSVNTITKTPRVQSGGRGLTRR